MRGPATAPRGDCRQPCAIPQPPRCLDDESCGPRAVPRRAGAGDRQAGRDSGACRAGRRAEPRTLVSAAALRAAEAAGAGAPARPGHVGRVSCSAGTRRRCGGWGDCSPRGGSRRCIGRSCPACRARAEGRIEAALLKQPRGTVGWRMVVDPQGQKAVTDYRVLGAADGRAWLELRPRTGRTHQIRVHCAALGCPVVGDPAYGGPADHKLQLHARAIALPLYPAKPPVAVDGAGAAAHGCAAAGARLARRPTTLRRGVRRRERAPRITIRRLSPEDAALFRDIRLEGLRRDPDALPAPSRMKAASELSFFAERLDRSAVFGAFRGAELLGVAGFYVQPGPKHRTRARYGACMSARRRAGPASAAGWSRRSSSMRAGTSS